MIGVVDDGDGWAVVMRDVEPFLLPDGRLLTRDESRRIIRAVHALHSAFWGEEVSGLASLRDRYTVLAPTLAERERDGSDTVPTLVARGWGLFADRVPPDVARPVMALLQDPAELVSALQRRPQTLVHGDLKDPERRPCARPHRARGLGNPDRDGAIRRRVGLVPGHFGRPDHSPPGGHPRRRASRRR